ncbi:hypothetical protein [Actinoplanes sp. NPDC049681]|uniref:hypothetical protein n=1 Tax=Actinoplanes sp. NPDC049681 TaxID=3363905 RepID=UPI0037A1F748
MTDEDYYVYPSRWRREEDWAALCLFTNEALRLTRNDKVWPNFHDVERGRYHPAGQIIDVVDQLEPEAAVLWDGDTEESFIPLRALRVL